jgi:hypothetical protein
LRSVHVAATYEKVGLTPRYSRAWHLSIFEQPQNKGFFNGHFEIKAIFSGFFPDNKAISFTSLLPYVISKL